MRRYQDSNRDKNHKEICQALQSVGWMVQDVSGVPNFVDVIATNGDNWLIEIKRITEKILLSQVEFLANWKGNSVILTSPDDVLNFSRFRESFKYAITSDRQSAALLAKAIKFKQATKAKNPELQVTEILGIIETNNFRWKYQQNPDVTAMFD